MVDLHWAQEFALANREEMMDRLLTEVSYAMYGEDGHQREIERERINCHHNFTQREHHFGADVWVTRKGAIQMKRGQKGVIPGSMGTRSYIVSGLANAFSYHSAPHGAGRRMSRAAAKKRGSPSPTWRRRWRASSTATPRRSSTRSRPPTRTSTR